MHEEILSKEQKALLLLLKSVRKDFWLAGGTGLALRVGHRRSIDFDLFTNKKFDNKIMERKAARVADITKVLVDKLGEYTFISRGAKITFCHYPYNVGTKENWNDVIKIPNLLVLAAMKAFTLGRRAKWKDYVDLYFVMRDFFTCAEISSKGREIYGAEFNEKLFRMQLSYFDDVSYEEKVDFLSGRGVSDKKIKKALVDFSLS